MEHIEQLIEIVTAEADSVDALANAVAEKQRALMELNAEDLQTALSAEEECTRHVEQLERKRIALLSQIYKSMASDTVRLSKVIADADTADAEKLSALQHRLLTSFEAIKKNNDINRVLIQNFRYLVKENLKILTESRGRTFIDKKV